MRIRCNLRGARGTRKLAEIAAVTGYSAGTLSRIERGTQLPPDGWLPALEAAYAIPRTEFYGSEALLAIQADEETR